MFKESFASSDSGLKDSIVELNTSSMDLVNRIELEVESAPTHDNSS